MRGGGNGPVKTGPELYEIWCAIPGLNQFHAKHYKAALDGIITLKDTQW
jgi:hypothetical protein